MALTRHMARNLDAYISQLDDYFEKLAAKGLGITESSRTSGYYSLSCIATGTRIALPTLRRSTELQKRIDMWVGKLGLTSSGLHGKGYGNGRVRKQLYEGLIKDYMTRLKLEGKKLPENPRRAGRPNWERISSESGIPITAFKGGTTAERLIRQAVEESGTEVYPESESWNTVSYGELFRAGSDWRKQELVGKPNASAQLYNTRTSLRYFMLHAGELVKGAGYVDDDIIGVEMLERFEETVRSLTAKIDIASSRRSFSGQIRRWHSYHLRIIRSGELPPQFSCALDTALCMASMSVAQLADAANVKAAKIYAWIARDNNPAVESFPAIRRIEHALNLPKDALTSRVVRPRPRRFSLDVYPECITVDDDEIELRKRHKIRARLRTLLPDDYDERSEIEKVEIAVWVVRNLLRRATAWHEWNRLMGGNPFRMSKLPHTVEEHVGQLARFKRGTLPPPGMNRNGTWSEAAESMCRDDLGSLLGYLTLPRDAPDPRFRGLGLDPGLFSLGMFVCSDFVDTWVRWKARRRNKDEDDSDPESERYCLYDLNMVSRLVNELKTGTGWIRQKPELANDLKPIPGFVDEAFIVRAKDDWDRACNEASANYLKLAAQIEEVAEEQRDPFEPVLTLLDVDHPLYTNPISAFKIFTRNIINDLPDPSTAPIHAARHVRHYLIARILIATALRSRNIRELTYREDNKGHLRREGDKWVIVIPYKRFKNKNSSFFGKKKKSDYRRVLADNDGLYHWIEEYIAVHRPILLQGGSSNIFFYNTPKKPVMSAEQTSTAYRNLTMRYFAHNPYTGRGVPGVMPHGPHAVRDIWATFVIQLTGSYELAAYMIGDSKRTVEEHYARFMPKDKARLVDLLINNVWSGKGPDSTGLKFLQELLGNNLAIPSL